MKKLAIICALALGLGALVAAGPSATAASPYPGTVHTKPKSHVKKVYKHPHSKKAKVKPLIRVATSGNAKAYGHLVVRVFKHRKHKTPHWKRVRVRVKKYNGHARNVNMGRFGHGKYKIVIKYLPKNGSIYKKSKQTKHFKVR